MATQYFQNSWSLHNDSLDTLPTDVFQNISEEDLMTAFLACKNMKALAKIELVFNL